MAGTAYLEPLEYGGLPLELERLPSPYDRMVAELPFDTSRVDAEPLAGRSCPHVPQWDVVGCVEIGGVRCLEVMCPECLATEYVTDDSARGSRYFSR